MKMLDMIYEHTTEDDFYTDSEEFTSSTRKINGFLSTIDLEYKKIMELDFLINESQVAAEKQGFELGFKYAMSLIKECGLK